MTDLAELLNLVETIDQPTDTTDLDDLCDTWDMLDTIARTLAVHVRTWNTAAADRLAPYLYGANLAESTRAAFRRDRRNTVTRERLEEAATVYKDISAEPGDTLAGVAGVLKVSRATAGRYIARARGLGLLEGNRNPK